MRLLLSKNRETKEEACRTFQLHRLSALKQFVFRIENQASDVLDNATKYLITLLSQFHEKLIFYLLVMFYM